MNDGSMQPFALTVDTVLDHAAKWHPDDEVPTAGAGGDTLRTGCSGLREGIDTRGNLVATGRARDLITSGGEGINPSQIEAVVDGLPEVSFAAFIGRGDRKWGERPVLRVEPRKAPDPSDEQLLAPPRDHVASWWIADAVVRLSKMPIATAGKVDKSHLRSQYGQS
jgi:fatty-acyl-CoA synthase